LSVKPPVEHERLLGVMFSNGLPGDRHPGERQAGRRRWIVRFVFLIEQFHLETEVGTDERAGKKPEEPRASQPEQKGYHVPMTINNGSSITGT